MIATLKAEFQKLLTVRSTYVISGLLIFLTPLFVYLDTSAIYVPKDSGPAESSANIQAPPPADTSQTEQSSDKPPELIKSKDLPKDKLANNISGSIGAVALFAVLAILLMAHEFRYNTIAYTLTAANSRSKVLLSKMIVVITSTAVLTTLMILLTVAATYLAVHIKGLNLPQQDIDWVAVPARLLAYLLSFSLLGLALITLLRNLTAAIVAIFMLPIVDSILAGLLRKNNIEPTDWLPFSALDRISSSLNNGVADTSLPSVSRAVLTFGAYLIIIWAVSWYLFLRRDAN